MQHWRLNLDLKKTFTTGETFRFLKVVIRIDEPVLQVVASILGKKVTQGTRAELEVFVRLNAPVWIANALYPGQFRVVELVNEGSLEGVAMETNQAQRLPLGLTYWVVYDTSGEVEAPSERRTSPHISEKSRNTWHSENDFGSSPVSTFPTSKNSRY